MTYEKALCGLEILVDMLSEVELLDSCVFFCVDNSLLGDALVPSFVKKTDFQDLLASFGISGFNATYEGYVFVYFGDDALMLTAIIIDSFKNYLDEGIHYTFNVQTGGSVCYKMGLEAWEVQPYGDTNVFEALFLFLTNNFLLRRSSKCNSELLDEIVKRLFRAGLY